MVIPEFRVDEIRRFRSARGALEPDLGKRTLLAGSLQWSLRAEARHRSREDLAWRPALTGLCTLKCC